MVNNVNILNITYTFTNIHLLILYSIDSELNIVLWMTWINSFKLLVMHKLYLLILIKNKDKKILLDLTKF